MRKSIVPIATLSGSDLFSSRHVTFNATTHLLTPTNSPDFYARAIHQAYLDVEVRIILRWILIKRLKCERD